mmetsp:Transcript_12119/g.27991  ORF Transcript_12119/g.27991 Transcript_12119/m.27991 type:complete len:265 (+) Transcript_12119:52-846(+)|eukprot:CAMPEP_0114556932 /NCGR_PEP_ID=MMETSP0114-20121206/9552_1 /TAXON_ID=31324 /ORGANISM="Goniomonas sp, Strain m" /LENGTH=264 /DNA_ID=CAMNT_0001742169 /DNA_START=37 /DNA_END=831 /DNA_ORIENTATION=-
MASRRTVHNSNAELSVDHCVIYGNENRVIGDHNTIIGHRNIVNGDHNVVTGDENSLTGSYNRSDGNENKNFGSHCVNIARAAGFGRESSAVACLLESAKPTQPVAPQQQSVIRKSLLGFRKAGQAPQPSDVSPAPEAYHCPVCGILLQITQEKMLEHIDMCLGAPDKALETPEGPSETREKPAEVDPPKIMLPDPYSTSGATPVVAEADERACKMCLEFEADTCIVDCGHVALCVTCILKVGASPAPSCPVCRKEISKAIRVFH